MASRPKRKRAYRRRWTVVAMVAPSKPITIRATEAHGTFTFSVADWEKLKAALLGR